MHQKLFPVKLFQCGLNTNMVMVYCNIYSHADGYRPTIAHIIKQTKLNKKTVMKHISELERLNMLKVDRAIGAVNRYETTPHETWILESDSCQEKSKKQYQPAVPVPTSGTSTNSFQKAVPVTGTHNCIDNNINNNIFTPPHSVSGKNSHNISSDNSEKQETKPKQHTAKNYTRVANQLAGLFDSEGYDFKKIKGWALNLTKHFGYEQIEANIQRIFEEGLAGKFAKAKPNLNTCTHIANGSIFG